MRRAALAYQDIVIAGYMLVVAALLVARAPPGPGLWLALACMALVLAMAVVARRARAIPRVVRRNLYPVVVVGATLGSYAMLPYVLPVVRPDSVDASLAAADARMFGGVAPSLWLEHANQPAAVEWLAFCYFNYYTLLLAFVVGVLWVVGPGPAAAEYGIGTALIYALGHLGYMAVPAFGPVVFYAGAFHEPLHGGTFLHLVLASVASGGATKDVFPSMHTGGSVWLALFALHQARRDRRFRVPAALTTFLAANIVAATLVLRWHYVVDVIAGLALASLVAALAFSLAPRETARRRALGLPDVWGFD